MDWTPYKQYREINVNVGMIDVQKYVDAAKNANAKGSIAWTLTHEDATLLIEGFKKAHPTFSHTLSVDWDDESMYRLTFKWEPGAHKRSMSNPILGS
jgi:hypothetical protein